MLSLEEIEQKTLWVYRYVNGERRVATSDKTTEYMTSELKDIDRAIWKNQPTELQEFYKSYEMARKMGRNDLIEIEDFYKEWVKNPKQFTPEHRPIKSETLHEILETLNPCSDLIIQNYDKYSLGNHAVGNFLEALDILSYDFDVVEITELYGYQAIIIQDDDMDKLEAFSGEANHNAIIHSKYGGDGKYDQ
ncbi:MAG: hypothetical protein VZS44_09165 [Bacilli bacterium]|nr:hypothetical protein [Bacilli bacterium]